MIVYEWFTNYLALTGSGHAGSMWQCPAHHDSTPSLSVREHADGSLLIHCHAGCPYFDVVDALSLPRWIWSMAPGKTPVAWLASAERLPTFPKMVVSSGGRSDHGPSVSVEYHVYVPDQIRLERRRYADGHKTLRWERRIGKDWEYLLGDIRLTDMPLYLKDYIEQARALREPIVLCESESSVDALLYAGIYATTWAGGASNPNIERLQRTLVGMSVVWIPDNDYAGRRASDAIVAGLQEPCALFVIWPEEGHDARDLLRLHGSDNLRRWIHDVADGVTNKRFGARHPEPGSCFGEAV
jgi:hypothetical protein